jgi:preprotein translocase subunit SecY
LLVTGACLVAWRAFEAVQVADVGPQLFLLQPRSYSVVALGVQPYVNALIVMTLARVISERLRAMSSDDEGRRRLSRWTRVLAAALAMGQAYGFTALLQADSLVPELDWFSRLALVLQLTAGTMTLVFLGDLIDEAGLGFGNGALLIYALGPVAIEMQRFLALATTASAYGDLSAYRPLAVWIAASIVLVLASVAVLRAFRAVPLVQVRHATRELPLTLPLVMSGVLRPPIFTSAVLFLPTIYSNYLVQAQPAFHLWLEENWTAYGINPWWDLLHISLAVLLVIGFAYFVVAIDFDAGVMARRLKQRRLSLEGLPEDVEATGYLRTRLWRLTFAGASFLALATVVVPVPVYFVTRALGGAIPLSGTDALLVTAVVLAGVSRVEVSRAGEGRNELSPAPSVI